LIQGVVASGAAGAGGGDGAQGAATTSAMESGTVIQGVRFNTSVLWRTSLIYIQDQSPCLLLSATPEILQRILKFAVYVDGGIVPCQVKPRANKFIWAAAQKKGRQVTVSDASPLTVVSLNMVCHAIYDAVALTHLFYKENTFKFHSHDAMLTYLAAITPERKAVITSISCPIYLAPKYHFRYDIYTEHAIRMLVLCTGLQELKMIVMSRQHFVTHAANIDKFPVSSF
jgi:hypothetical protein